MIKALPDILKVGIIPYIVILPPNDDLDTILLRIGKDDFTEWLCKNTVRMDKYFINKVLDEYEEKVITMKTDTLNKLLPVLSVLSNSIYGKLHKEHVYTRLGISPTESR